MLISHPATFVTRQPRLKQRLHDQTYRLTSCSSSNSFVAFC